MSQLHFHMHFNPVFLKKLPHLPAEAGVIFCWLSCGVLHGGGQLGRSRILRTILFFLQHTLRVYSLQVYNWILHQWEVAKSKVFQRLPIQCFETIMATCQSDWDAVVFLHYCHHPIVDCQPFSTIPWRGCNAVGYWDRIAWSCTFRSNESPPANQAGSSCLVSIGLLMLLMLRCWRGLKFTLGWNVLNVFGLSHIASSDELLWLVATGWAPLWTPGIWIASCLESILWA